jgi:hypothetical protein
MTMDIVDEFNAYRTKMNDHIMKGDNLVIKRLFNLDSNAYKEMLGLACSMVLRCDDCYPLGKCHELRVTHAQNFAIASLVGGTIVIPHLHRAVEFWEALQQSSQNGG